MKARSLALMSPLLVACGGSYPEPTNAAVQTAAAVRSAEEIGANANPSAQLHLRYARDQLAAAQTQMKEGDNREAELMLARASADADLAIILAKVNAEEQEAQRVKAEVESTRSRLGR
jgi:hypothetical protein